MGALKLDYLPNYSYSDYVNWEGNWELINGIPYAMAPSPLRTHQNLSVLISRFLSEQSDKCPNCEVLAEFDYKISDNTVLRPDIVLVCDEKNEKHLTKTPEIVVEIVSRSSAFKDENIKFKLYETEKVKYYILIYPEDLVAKVYKLKDSNFEKEGVFDSEVYEFKNSKCPVSLDFSKIFKRFNNK